MVKRAVPAGRQADLSPENALELITGQLEKGRKLAEQSPFNSDDTARWEGTTRDVLDRSFGPEHRNVNYFVTAGGAVRRGMSLANWSDWQRAKLARQLVLLESCLEQLALRGAHPGGEEKSERRSVAQSAADIVATVIDRFHLVARQLRERHSQRLTLDIGDEYDVQDLLHALLRLFFDDVRSEEWTPSYAGGASRMDFLLKGEEIVIEVKKTRNGLGAKEVGDQLLIDIGRYAQHPDCKSLACFVYDPEARITNPAGLERDLSRRIDGLDVRVFVRPR